MSFRRSSAAMVALVLLMAGLQARVMAFPVDGDQTALPAKTELNEDAIDRPREVFRSELWGRKSYLVNLGNLHIGTGHPAKKKTIIPAATITLFHSNGRLTRMVRWGGFSRSKLPNSAR